MRRALPGPPTTAKGVSAPSHTWSWTPAVSKPVAKEGIFHHMARQTRQAVDEADAGAVYRPMRRAGLTGQDREVAARTARSGARSG